MRLELVRIFIDSTAQLLAQLIGPQVRVDSMTMRPTPMATSDVMAIIGLVGDGRGRVIFDMDSATAIKLADQLIGEPSPGMTPLVRSSIAELASMAIGRAISRINDAGTRLEMSPPTVITGTKLASYDHCLETLVVPLLTPCGEVRVNITIQDYI
jgi:chemotaxis protein CheX